MTEEAPKAPREITVSFFVNALKAVDAIGGTVELDFQMYASWIDESLIGVPVEERPPYDEESRKEGDERPCCYNPKLEVNNNVSLETLWSLYPPVHQNPETGFVIWGARYRGSISNEMDLAMFPLDSDGISISVGPKDETNDKCVIKIDPKKHGFPDAPGDRIKKSNLAEWSVDVPSVRLGLSGPTGSGNFYSNIEFCIMVHRNFMYYMWKVLAIVYLLIASMFVIFVMDPVDDFADRINICLTLILAAVAFLYVVGESLPKVPYLTLLDKLMLLAFFFIFLGGVESLVVLLAARHGKGDLQKKIDMWSAIFFPIVYFGLNLYYLMSGIRYRMILINNKDSEEYQKQLALDSKIKVQSSANEKKTEEAEDEGVAKDKDSASDQESEKKNAKGVNPLLNNPMYNKQKKTAGKRPTHTTGHGSKADPAKADTRSPPPLRRKSTFVEKLQGISDNKIASDKHAEEESARLQREISQSSGLSVDDLLLGGVSAEEAASRVINNVEKRANMKRNSIRRRSSITSSQKY